MEQNCCSSVLCRTRRISTGRAKDILASYLRPGKALLIVVRDAPNNYAGEAQATIQLDRKKLGFSPTAKLAAYDMESMARNRIGQIDGDILKVNVIVIISPPF